MKYCCPDFKEALRKENIILVIKENVFRFAGAYRDYHKKLKYCPYCGERIEL